QVVEGVRSVVHASRTPQFTDWTSKSLVGFPIERPLIINGGAQEILNKNSQKRIEHGNHDRTGSRGKTDRFRPLLRRRAGPRAPASLSILGLPQTRAPIPISHNRLRKCKCHSSIRPGARNVVSRWRRATYSSPIPTWAPT